MARDRDAIWTLHSYCHRLCKRTIAQGPDETMQRNATQRKGEIKRQTTGMSENDSGAAFSDAPFETPGTSGNTNRMPPLAFSVTGSLHIKLPAAFKGDCSESFSSLACHFEVVVQATTPQGTDFMNMLASVLPTWLFSFTGTVFLLL